MNKSEIKNKLSTSENLSDEDILRLRGRLIKILEDEVKTVKEQSKLSVIRLELYDELTKHKKHIKKMVKSDGYSIPNKVGLKVKEIAVTISKFKEKYDLVNKAKTSIIGTGINTLFTGALTLGLTALSGTPVTLAALSTVIPIAAYCGLTSVLKMPFTENSWTKFVKFYESKDENSKKVCEFVNINLKNNKSLLELCNKKRNESCREKIIELNNKIILQYSNLISKSPNDELKKILIFEKINLLYEQRKLFEAIKQDFIKDKIEMTNVEFVQLEKEILHLDVLIFKENSYVNEVLKETGKEVGITVGSMFVARAILSTVYPAYALSDIVSILTPLTYVVLNSVSKMGSIKDKIRLEKDAYDKLKVNINMDKLQEMLAKKQNKAMSMG